MKWKITRFFLLFTIILFSCSSQNENLNIDTDIVDSYKVFHRDAYWEILKFFYNKNLVKVHENNLDYADTVTIFNVVIESESHLIKTKESIVISVRFSFPDTGFYIGNYSPKLWLKGEEGAICYVYSTSDFNEPKLLNYFIPGYDMVMPLNDSSWVNYNCCHSGLPNNLDEYKAEYAEQEVNFHKFLRKNKGRLGDWILEEAQKKGIL